MKKALLILGIIVTASVAYWWFATQADSPLRVQTAEIGRRTVESVVVAEGFVRAKSYPLSTERAGRVVSVTVREGDRIAAGATLLTLDSSDADFAIDQHQATVATGLRQVAEATSALAASRATALAAQAKARSLIKVAEAAVRDAKRGTRPELIARAEHELAQAKVVTAEAARKRDRAERLYAEGVYSLAVRDAARTEHEVALAQQEAAEDALNLLRAGPLPADADVARAQLAAAQSDLRSALALNEEIAVRQRQVESARSRVAEARTALAQAQSELGKLVLKSPVDGVVIRVGVEPGAWAMPGVPVLSVSSREDLHAEAEVRSEDVASVKPGQRVELLVPGESATPISGIVERLSVEAEPKPDSIIRSRIVRCRIRIAGDARNLVPGQELDVRFQSRRSNVLSVRNEAIALDGAAPSVWLVRSGVAERRVVELGATDGDWTEIVDGLVDGDRVIAPIPEGLIEGQKVTPIDGP